MTAESLRQALGITVEARSALLAGDLEAYFDLLERREPLLVVPDKAVESPDVVHGLAAQILSLDLDCTRLLEGIEAGLTGELAEIRRVRQNQRAYASSVIEPNERGSVVQLRG